MSEIPRVRLVHDVTRGVCFVPDDDGVVADYATRGWRPEPEVVDDHDPRFGTYDGDAYQAPARSTDDAPARPTSATTRKE